MSENKLIAEVYLEINHKSIYLDIANHEYLILINNLEYFSYRKLNLERWSVEFKTSSKSIKFDIEDSGLFHPDDWVWDKLNSMRTAIGNGDFFDCSFVCLDSIDS